MKRTIIGDIGLGLSAAVLGATLAACGEPAAEHDTPAVTTEHDGPDCETDDRRNHETPDCGFYVGTGSRRVFVEYSWVKAGKTEAPQGWNRAAEIAAASKAAAPRATSRRR